MNDTTPAPPLGGIVAIGMSAGGLAACSAVLRNLPIDTGLAFVVIQHLDPDHDSQLDELLAKATAMPVAKIADGMLLMANRVHVMPADVTLALEGHALRTRPRSSARVPMPIDAFLLTLVEQSTLLVIAVILSGNGADGAQGVKAIHQLDGICLAQDPAEAECAAMPTRAIATGCVDLVLTAARLGPEIAMLARRLAITEDPAEGPATPREAPAAGTADERALADTVIARLRAATGVDFAHYRRTTVHRRLHRRVLLRHLPNLAAYLAFLDDNPGELQELAGDLLISVTRFFRDPEVFGFLAQVVFPDLIRQAAADGIVRIWVAGCSTGEEAYSVAMTFVETARRMQSQATCQVFATDVNETVLERARRAAYPENIAADVEPERLARFFSRTPDGHRIRREIRNLCVFSRHDLVGDPPLSRMDLVSCRNLLIYLPEAQRLLVERFHFALEPRGYLLLGRAESTASLPGLFAPVDKDAHVFRALEVVSRRGSERSPRDARRGKPPLAVDPEGRGAEYEELVAANEELQSLNEELASSKEEIESINEELTTLNQELSSRNDALRIANEFSEATLDTIRSGLVVLDANGLVIAGNRAFHRLFQLAPERAENRRLADVLPEYFADPRVAPWLASATTGGKQLEAAEFSFDVPSDGCRILALCARRVIPGRLLVTIDEMTQLRRIEADLSQSQKMEAIGQLAAGVAHDFNNLLTVISGGAQLMAMAMPADSPLRPVVTDVEAASRRAAELTHQLLAYAGRGRHVVEFVDLSEIVVQSARLLHSSVPTHVQCRLDLDRELPRLLADRSQIHQIVDNLLKNAFEATGAQTNQPGTVTVRTGHEVVAHDAVGGIAPGTRLAAGDYLFVEVQDTGIGMTADHIRRMFDPFFTTKFTGRGLGLAAVQGIVRQHAGAIQVSSLPGRGTSIRVLLSLGPQTAPPPAAPAPPAPRWGTETIAVVDDEPKVLETIQRTLESFGYRVLPAVGGPEALALLRAEPSIQALVLDATMPGMNGLETLKEVRALRPDLPVVVCSGLGDSSVEAAFTGLGVAAFVNKPFQLHDFGLAVAKCFPAGR